MILFPKFSEEWKGQMSFVLGTYTVIHGLEAIIYEMNITEIAQVRLSYEEVFGKVRFPGIPPKSVLIIEINLLNCSEVKDENSILGLESTLSPTNNIQLAMDIKLKGNHAFQRGNYSHALNLYKKSLSFLSNTQEWSNEEDAYSKSVRVACLLNISK
ncbi:uncharacterized protein CMU_033520 [Cryptosporidium muris RN66]|uniref:peptidylprolyl isomerase n=1 Tax=Cryptosporidium muris (strain RN66) TaxID=441375 RepID=B6AFH6_CRYMR|nr:uncharacterized protein CMU_033520 [Cryptosporidium muris RN66]EEA06967.1 hypothetical protein, conserved [Cryptosporidium muris RN66]|eukprot:XP_002141316.1 hypothetical protein [Cryptosporidium muris RN66]